MPFGEKYEYIPRGVALIRAAGVGFAQVTRSLASVVTRTSAGLYVVTLVDATPSANAKSRLTMLGLTDASGTVTHTSDTVKTISTFNQAGAATDVDFDFEIDQLV